MADISKCAGLITRLYMWDRPGGNPGNGYRDDPCPHRDRCYRFTAPAADVFQSWIAPVIRDDGSCAKFVSNRDDEDDGA